MEREKKALQEYVENDARETKARLDAENKRIQEKLDREAAELKKKIQDADEEKEEEMKILQQKIDLERKMLNDKMEREKEELAEEMERAEADRKRETANLKSRMEEEAKQTQNGIVTMFERLKGENESRKTEIHGLKDILVRENEKLARDQMLLDQKLVTGLGDLNDKLDQGIDTCRKEIKKSSDSLTDTIKADKKEIKEKIDDEYADLKRKVEMDSNEMRDKMQSDKKAIVIKLEEAEDERQKEAKLIRTQLQREREETREAMANESKHLQDQVDGNTRDLMEIIKKEKAERERDVESVKRKMDDEKQELQLSIDRDRDNLTKRLNEEHDQRRIEQMEVQQRLENNEKSGKSDMQELFNRVKRYEEEARIDNDEVRNALTRAMSNVDEKILRDKKELRECLDHEAMELNKRVDKANMERLNESADVQTKLGMLGKSASRHLDNLKHKLQLETQNLLELMQKSCSVAFNAHRDEGHTDGGECYVTFTSCTVNIGNGFVPRSGIFQCPEPGLYFFTLTVCTYDGKKCLLILRKNEKDVCAMIDQDGNENRGKTMISQTCMMELEIGDRVQVYAVTGTGLSDMKNSHYTQFSGVILRPSPETVRSAIRQAAQAEEDDISIRESFRGFTPTPSAVELRAASRQRSVVRNIEPTPTATEGQKVNGLPESVPVSTSVPQTPPQAAPQQNGVPAQPKEAAPITPPVPVTPKERTKKKDKEDKKEKEEDKEKDKDKPQQSYLALTGLGGEKKAAKPAESAKPSPTPAAAGPANGGETAAVKTPAAAKKSESSGFYSFLKR